MLHPFVDCFVGACGRIRTYIFTEVILIYSQVPFQLSHACEICYSKMDEGRESEPLDTLRRTLLPEDDRAFGTLAKQRGTVIQRRHPLPSSLFKKGTSIIKQQKERV
jgi:hypothetical protein